MTQLLNPPAAQRLQVDIWSDIACPWCYIGKRRFEQALEQFEGKDKVEVVWHSFELDPSAPVSKPSGPNAMRDGLASKYGRSAAEAQGMLDSMTQTAAKVGLEYHFDQAQPANTFLSHQLIHFAAEHGLQDAMKERLLLAYFSEGQHLGQLDTLVKLGAEVGLNADEVRTVLEQQTYAEAVRSDEAQAQAYGISGVPFFVLGNKYGVSGAQAPGTILSALKQVWNEQAPLQLIGAADAEGCEDGSCAVPQG
ncbi:DsbA family oxidoreductase [Deinococcus detaillensis]|uniref:DsbA family oxidoreductase n=1 Tax=Deinococcus detaillensis TaxID=2592048 RepID=A0A553UF78_9DEIO|nr:DsbA family oxidoreductase [Deinococcus detaillensis]TSA78864.1 DsbA family oxidoreductase [Deinococcus detaillensis]